MSAWLLKTEPSTYSFSDLVKSKRAVWDGVKNPTALKYLREMKPGDEVVIYHTGDERAAVGLAKVASAPRPDPKDQKLTVVELAAGDKLARGVSLAELKGEPLFAESPLVTQGRLAVMPLDGKQLKRLLVLAKAASR